MIHSILIVSGGVMASPFAVGWFMRLVTPDTLWARVFLVTWLWSFTYWGTLYHSKQVSRLFERIMKSDKDKQDKKEQDRKPEPEPITLEVQNIIVKVEKSTGSKKDG